MLDENRFLAARDGMAASLIDPCARAPRARACRGVDALLEVVRAARRGARLRDRAGRRAPAGHRTGAERQLEAAKGADRLPGLVHALADAFLV